MPGRPGMMLGRLPKKENRNTLSFAKYLKATAPPPPPEKAYYEYIIPTDAWGMLGNDTVGDCTCADEGHSIMLWTGNSGTMFTPTTDSILAAYSAITGYNPITGVNDNGAAITDVLEYFRTTGIAGHKINGWVEVNYEDTVSVKLSVYLFGKCTIGVNLPNSAMDQFTAGQPWNVVSDDGGIDGGHDIPVVGYGAEGCTCITWGRTQQMSWEWFAKYVDEAYACISLDWLSTNGVAPNTLNLTTLTADLAALRA